MKAILVLMDTFRYDALKMCGGDERLLPNFKRLTEHCVNYTSHFAGSLPCMPARRELHTGRYNFLHRGWGPLEPQDDSMPQLLRENGVYSHLVSDHYHYWDDGGSTYHSRYSSWENVRGHEADPWKGYLGTVDVPEFEHVWNAETIRKNYVNRKYMPDFKSSSLVRTFDLGMEFIDTNFEYDQWFLQIESFTPHEPFVTYPEFRQKLPAPFVGQDSEWGSMASRGDARREEDTRNDYRTLLVECDSQMGRLLDRMDRYDLWKDTMVIFTADHGTLMGEHGEWNKNRQPLFQEVVHTPFLVWDPRDGRKDVEDPSLNRMIDVPATLLDYFGIPLPWNMIGKPVRQGCAGASDDKASRECTGAPDDGAVRNCTGASDRGDIRNCAGASDRGDIRNCAGASDRGDIRNCAGASDRGDIRNCAGTSNCGDIQSCEGALFGYYGSYVCCTDGRYVYMRAAQNPDNKPLYTYFLMPTELFQRFPAERMQNLELMPGRTSTKGVPLLRMETVSAMPPDFMYRYKTLLYDLESDPMQLQPLDPDTSPEAAAIEAKMKALLIKLMVQADAPDEQFVRLGLECSCGVQSASGA